MEELNSDLQMDDLEQLIIKDNQYRRRRRLKLFSIIFPILIIIIAIIIAIILFPSILIVSKKYPLNNNSSTIGIMNDTMINGMNMLFSQVETFDSLAKFFLIFTILFI